jgi:hypothetical protein
MADRTDTGKSTAAAKLHVKIRLYPISKALPLWHVTVGECGSYSVYEYRSEAGTASDSPGAILFNRAKRQI